VELALDVACLCYRARQRLRRARRRARRFLFPQRRAHAVQCTEALCYQSRGYSLPPAEVVWPQLRPAAHSPHSMARRREMAFYRRKHREILL